MAKELLTFQNISKEFPAVRALDDVSFSVKSGQVHGLIGENGAGKSTLMKILGGDYQASSGQLFIDGKGVLFHKPQDAIEKGIAIIHQELQLVEEFMVYENLFLGRWAKKASLLDKNKMKEQSRLFLQECGIDIEPTAKLSDLTIGQQQMVEIAKALMLKAKIIALDEPTSSLSEAETVILFNLIKKLQAQGCGLIYISHRMAEIFEICDSCTILRDGKHVVSYESLANVNRGLLVEHMTGREINDIYDYQKRKLGKNILSVQDIYSEKVKKTISFDLKKGEILGFFGLVGAGRSEVMHILAGDEKAKGGEIILLGESLSLSSPKSAIEKGIMFCSEDRKKEGIITERPVDENLNISSRRHYKKWIFLNAAQEDKNAHKQIADLAIKTPSKHQKINNLSGGNQQKVILGRWLSEKNINILIMDEPTRGIDVGAKSEIYQILYNLAQQGISIIVVSSELPEIMGITDRLFVMREGEISQEFMRDDYDEQQILHYAFPTLGVSNAKKEG